MRQILLERPGVLLERQVPAPTRETGMVLVRILRVGICGSDYHAYAGRQPAYTFPRVIGHELSGEVLEVPAGETRVAPGDLVADQFGGMQGARVVDVDGLGGDAEDVVLEARRPATDIDLTPVQVLRMIDTLGLLSKAHAETDLINERLRQLAQAAKATADADKNLYTRLAAEERQHVDILQSTLTYLNDTGHWFLWDEQAVLDGG